MRPECGEVEREVHEEREPRGRPRRGDHDDERDLGGPAGDASPVLGANGGAVLHWDCGVICHGSKLGLERLGGNRAAFGLVSGFSPISISGVAPWTPPPDRVTMRTCRDRSG